MHKRWMLDRYLHRSATPWHALLFVTPMMAAYEIGTGGWGQHVTRTSARVLATDDLAEAFGFFGATGRLMPAAAVVVLLLAMHLAQRDRWKPKLGVLGGMLGESLLLALPLLVAGLLISNFLLAGDVSLAEPTRSASAHPTGQLVLLSLGAGVYEELVFRLIAVPALIMLLGDVAGMKPKLALTLAVFASGIAFSLHHYRGAEVFAWPSFAFRGLAGIYFGLLLHWRGFGIAAGTHAAYDLLVVLN